MKELIDFANFRIYDDGNEIHLLAPNKEVFDKTPAHEHGISFEIFDENGLLDTTTRLLKRLNFTIRYATG